ncbi:MAG: peptide deformylase [SAR202 cluster bacterium Io17-Chloro-G2]|nr:MAG: peptide deformylase [SAR202 cluster bacterium Io17-Chloro-G2]
MAVLRMRILQETVLRKQAKKIGKILPSLKKLTSDMVETMHEHKGVGIAANQVGSLQKVCIIQTPEMEEPLVLVNPEITNREGEREVVEGCLSIPGYRGMVKRSVKVRARALGLDGKVIRINADELLAQALEHETDHLHGILYVDHLASRDDLWKIDDEPEDDEPEDDEPEDDEESLAPAAPESAG